jgi:hypothetical protein
MTRQYGSPTNFTAEAKNYEREVWNSLSSQQKRQVSDLKGAAGWINGYTPPAGFVIDTNGYETPSTHVISAMQPIQHVPPPPPPQHNFGVVPLPPPPVPAIINTNALQAGTSFGRQGSRAPPTSDQSQSNISMISINGRSYSGPIFDTNGNRLA